VSGKPNFIKLTNKKNENYKEIAENLYFKESNDINMDIEKENSIYFGISTWSEYQLKDELNYGHWYFKNI
jgi:putative AlgH/UPF0301 family transcriptional regulator